MSFSSFSGLRSADRFTHLLMEQSTGRIKIIGVPPRHDGTNESIDKLNSLLKLDRGFGYKYIGVSCSLSNETVLGQDKVHLEAEGKSKLKRVIKNKIIC